MTRYFRKVIKIRGVDSPNVRLALAELKAGKPVSNKVLIPGVLTYEEYRQRLATWDKIRACVGLDANFYEGPEQLLYPPEWLNRSNAIAESLRGAKRTARAMGVDPGEGGDPTVWTVGDERGLMYLKSLQTPDTSVIPGITIALMREYGVPPEKVMFDRGGGGYEHACQLNSQGYRVQSVGFGEKVDLEPVRRTRMVEERKDVKAEKYAYVNRRAEMYGTLRLLLDPANEGWGIPAEYTELRRQLAPMPLWYDEEGRMYLPPKQRRTHEQGKDRTSEKPTINKLIGCSPDEADSCVLCVYGMTKKSTIARAGAA